MLPGVSHQVEFEAEIGVVIGDPAPGRRPDGEAERGIGGFVCVNDVTCRDLQKTDGQWGRAKGFDTFCPVGPRWSGRPRLAHARGHRPGQRRRSASGRRRPTCTSRFPFLVSFHQRHHDARAGRPDRHRHPGRRRARSHDGDVVEVEIPGVGMLSNPVRDGQTDDRASASVCSALPGYPLAEIPSIKRRLHRGRDRRHRPWRGRQRHPAARRGRRGDDRGAPRVRRYSKYGFQQGLPAFRRPRRAGWSGASVSHFDPATETLPLIGSKEGLSHLPFAVVNPGDVAIVPEPGYQAYLGGSILAGAEPYIAALRPENDFLLELDQVPEAVLRRAKLVFVNYPEQSDRGRRDPGVSRAHGGHLPTRTGSCWPTTTRTATSRSTAIARRASSSSPGARDVALEFFSLSKSFSMTGWRIGFAVGPAELITALTRVKSYVDTGPFLAVQKAGAAALDQAEALVAPIRAELAAPARRRRGGAPRGGLRARGAEGGHVSLGGRCPPASRRPRSPSGRIEATGTVVLPGSAFGPAGEGFFRIALTVGAGPAADRRGRRLGRTLEELRRGELAPAS